MAIHKKGKRKEERGKNTDRRVLDVWMGVWTYGRVGVWACGRVGMRMGVQPCEHADADGCKQKQKKKNTYWGVLSVWMGVLSVWMGVWACGRADGRAEADNCKEKKKERKGKKKRKTHWSGRVDMLRMGVRALAGGRGWL